MAEKALIPYDKELVKEFDKANEEYISISKWLIGLSTGTIVFITGMSQSTGFWKGVLALGLLLLIISILLGIKFVTLMIDKLLIQLGSILTLKELNYFKEKDLESEYEFESKTQKVKDILRNLDNDFSDWSNEVKKIRKDHIFCFSWQKKLFYIGIVLVALFRLFHI